MTDFAPDRPHPLPGFVANPEWQYTTTRRAELYLAHRARTHGEPVRNEYTRPTFALVILAVIGVAVALVGVWL